MSSTFPKVGFGYPVPDDKGMVFFIQRSMNTHTAVYVAHKRPNGRFDTKSPVEAYWRGFAAEGVTSKLTFLERNFAYGVRVKIRGGDPRTFDVNLTSYPERKAILRENKAGKPMLTLMLGEYEVQLICAYVTLKGTGKFPSVTQIDIVGKDLASGQYVVETVTP